VRRPVRISISFGILTLMGACGGGSNAPLLSLPQEAPQAPLELRSWSLDHVDPSRLGLSQAAVDEILSYIFTDKATQAAVILKDGYLIGSRYAEGHDQNSMGTSWSVAKSFYSGALGIAIDEGWIESVDQKASVFLTEWLGTDKEDITLRNILEMRSGLPGGDHGGKSFIGESNQTDAAIAMERSGIPGVTFRYSNPTSQLFEPILQRATGLDAHTYLADKILAPIGIDINRVGLWLDPTGQNPMTYCCIDMRPLDFIRFGLLYARGGEWEGTRLIPTSYVDESLTAQSPSDGSEWSAPYGFQWWILNSPFFGGEPVDDGWVAALGFHGQKILVWPDQDLVLVILTLYQHSANQGYVLSDLNWPNTCEGRNGCSDSVGDAVPTFSNLALVNLLGHLRTYTASN
jgi:CubicO group peptidase (beta-lactamase class C family)